MDKKSLLQHVNELFPEIVKVRRHIHQNPELSFKEYNTQDFILRTLSEYGIEGKKIAETGVTAIIGQGEDCIALRADIDALPITEETGLPFASQNDGVMHACGHDMHTSMLLGAAIILKKNEDKLTKKVKLIFQPGEEQLPGGASIMIKEGILENPTPSAVYGQHIYPGAEVGKVLTCPGPVMASADELYWTITGRSTHAAQPHLGHDPILCASSLIQSYQNMITKYRDPLDAGVIQVTSINGGSATNIIPDTVEMKGTMRAFNEEWRAEFHDKLASMTKQIGDIYGCSVDFEIRKGYPFVDNSPELALQVKDKAIELFGNSKYEEFVPKMWGEDFAYYSQTAKSVFWFIGVRDREMTDMPPLHNSKMSPNEEAMKTGMAMMLSVCFDSI